MSSSSAAKPVALPALDDGEPLWPDRTHPDLNDSRLNLFPMNASLFGRLIPIPPDFKAEE